MSTPWTDLPATSSQKTYLRNLSSTNAIYGIEVTRADTMTRMADTINVGLTGGEASTLIDTARRARPHSLDQMPAHRREIANARKLATSRAMFGLDYNKDETIERLERILAEPFVSAAQCWDLIRAASHAPSHPTAQTPLRLAVIEGIDDLNLSEGHYAVFDTDDVLRFYRIYTPASGAHEGEPVIRRFAGDNLLGLYPSEALSALKVIDANPDAAAYRFSDTFTRCWVCGRALTDAVSRVVSVGPTCRGFANHTGLRNAAQEVDHDPERRKVFRALREWAIAQGFKDPAVKEDRVPDQMTASRVASAWSGIPGVLGLPPVDAVAEVSAALTGNDISDLVREGLANAPKDTLLLLIESGVLGGQIMEILSGHKIGSVRDAATEFFLARLAM